MKVKLTLKQWIGSALIVVSTLFIPVLAFLPGLHIPAAHKAIIAGILIVCGQILTWVGGILLGAELAAKYKRYLNPRNWRKYHIE